MDEHRRQKPTSGDAFRGQTNAGGRIVHLGRERKENPGPKPFAKSNKLMSRQGQDENSSRKKGLKLNLNDKKTRRRNFLLKGRERERGKRTMGTSL